MYRRFFVTTLVTFSFAVLGGCSGDSTGPGGSDDEEEGGPPPGPGIVINLLGASFSPRDVTIDPGETVRWYNQSGIFHTITPDDPDQEGVWDAATTQREEVALTHVFNVPGQTYSYRCTVHPGMVGTITVRQQGS